VPQNKVTQDQGVRTKTPGNKDRQKHQIPGMVSKASPDNNQLRHNSHLQTDQIITNLQPAQ
jgi:hypothetical protein